MAGLPLNRDRIAGIALIMLAGLVAVETRELPIGSLARPGPGYAPLALAALLAVFGLIVAWRGVGPAVAMSHWAESAHVVKLLGGCAAATFVLEDLGYRLTVFLLVAFYFGWLERRHPIAAIIFALGLSLGTFALFAEALRVPLPRGPWGF